MGPAARATLAALACAGCGALAGRDAPPAARLEGATLRCDAGPEADFRMQIRLSVPPDVRALPGGGSSWTGTTAPVHVQVIRGGGERRQGSPYQGGVRSPYPSNGPQVSSHGS
jgi:hypothetical protein